MKAYKNYSTRQTPQAEPIPGEEMVENSAGGFVFGVDDWKRLERFLILGSEGGTYYVGERKLTKENADCVLRCIKADGKRTVDVIVEISKAGRAPKNDPALFALAMCAGLGDGKTKGYALEQLSKVARIGTHLFHFAEYVQQFRGWGRGLKNAVRDWYQEMSLDRLAYQAVKYQRRDGWSHRDLLRLSHPKTDDKKRNAIYKWITTGDVLQPTNKVIEGYEKAMAAEKPKPYMILDYGLTREMIPTSWLQSVDVWGALLRNMPITAMVRNLGKMTSVGLLAPMSDVLSVVTKRLKDPERIKQARVHPLSVLVAMKTYANGHGLRGKLSWNPVREIVDALDECFYLSFKGVEPTNKRCLLALDVSGSMGWNNIAGMPITPREASAAMALTTAKVEPIYSIMGFSHHFVNLSISPRQRLDDVVGMMTGVPMGATDCSLPMLWATKGSVPVDVFVIYTDNETWYGNIHPCQALDAYRQKMGIDAKLVVVGMTATGFSIANPDDIGTLDVVGFDTATPNIISDFVR